jgi:hypothetical protein
MRVLSNVVALVVLVGIAVVGLNLWARRSGYAIPGRNPARCGQGHLFLTTWVMGGSLTKVRFGPLTRWGRCPFGNHWTTMHPVKEADLTDDERHQLHGEAGS